MPQREVLSEQLVDWLASMPMFGAFDVRLCGTLVGATEFPLCRQGGDPPL